jgi:uncharacterized OB-fold protein
MMADIPPIAPGIFTLPPYDLSPPELLGGLCDKCNQYYFPRPKYCRICLGPVKETVLGSEGTIYSFTVIRKKPPFGLPLPYSVGFIDLQDCRLRIFCLLDPGAVDDLRIGLPVQLKVGPLGHDGHGHSCLRPYFSPKHPEGNRGKGEG